MEQTDKMWARMMHVECVIVEKLNFHDEAKDRGYEWKHRRDLLTEHEYWLFCNEYRMMNT